MSLTLISDKKLRKTRRSQTKSERLDDDIDE